MKAITAYTKGWKKILDHKRMWLLLFALNFLVAILSLIPLSGFLKETLGDTLATKKILSGFDYTFLSDFLNQYGQEISLVLNQSIGFIILFFFFSIFMMGGILVILKNDEEAFYFEKFWSGAGKYFWRLFRLTSYFLIVQGLIFGLFTWIYLLMIGTMSPFELESEVVLINSFMILFPLYIIVATLFFMIQDYAKIHLVQADQTWLTQPIKETFQLVFNNIIPFFFLYLLNILTFLLLYGIYWLIKTQVQVDSIFLFFIIAQLFIFGRVGIRLLNLSSATFLYQSKTQ